MSEFSSNSIRNRYDIRRDDYRRHGDIRDGGGGRQCAECSSRDSRLHDNDLDYRSSRNSLSYVHQSDCYSSDRGFHSFITSSRSSRDYPPRNDQPNPSRGRNPIIHQDSEEAHPSYHYPRHSRHDIKRPRTDEISDIHHLKFERDIHRLEAQATEATLRKVQAERMIVEHNLKREEAKLQLEILRRQVGDTMRAAPVDVSADGVASLQTMPVVAGVMVRSNGLDTAVNGTNLSVSMAAAAISFNAEDSYDDLPSRPKAGGNARKRRNSKKKTKCTPKNETSRKAKKSLASNKAVYTEIDMMSTYKPTIVGHSLVMKKFLVQWNKNDDPSGPPCTSWMSFDNFLFCQRLY